LFEAINDFLGFRNKQEEVRNILVLSRKAAFPNRLPIEEFLKSFCIFSGTPEYGNENKTQAVGSVRRFMQNFQLQKILPQYFGHIWNFSWCFSIFIYLFHGFSRSRTMFSGIFDFHGSLGGKYYL